VIASEYVDNLARAGLPSATGNSSLVLDTLGTLITVVSPANNILEFDLGRCSGYYVFDVEWLKINGEWKYRHTLLDAISNCIIDDAIYDTEDETTVEKFLKESTTNKNKKAITTDLDSKYPQIIEKLGFKHQLCIFHTKKSLNRQLKVFKDKFRLLRLNTKNVINN